MTHATTEAPEQQAIQVLEREDAEEVPADLQPPVDVDLDDPVDLYLLGTFPASDPPSWWAGPPG